MARRAVIEETVDGFGVRVRVGDTVLIAGQGGDKFPAMMRAKVTRLGKGRVYYRPVVEVWRTSSGHPVQRDVEDGVESWTHLYRVVAAGGDDQ